MKKILLVDDSQTVRTISRRYAEAMGLTTLEAENGVEALHQFQRHPDLHAVLLDWNMPVLDGLGFLKALRAEPGGDRPIVVMCTTEHDLPHMMQAIGAGANEYIIKPFTEEIVREKFQEAGVV